MKLANQVHEEDRQCGCHRLQVGGVERQQVRTDLEVPDRLALVDRPDDEELRIGIVFEGQKGAEKSWTSSLQSEEPITGDDDDAHTH